jgi:hypothetical protein
VYLGIAVTVVVAGGLVSRSSTSSGGSEPSPAAPASASPSSSIDLATPFPVPEAPPRKPLDRPAAAIAEYGVLTDRSETDLARFGEPSALADPAGLAALVTPDLCGDTAACEAVRGVVRDGARTSVHVLASSVWNVERMNVDASGRALSPAERREVARAPRVVAVRVSGPITPQQLPLRSAIALAAAIGRATGGMVWDQLLDRLEKPADFAKHAVTTPLERPCFRSDRVGVLFEPEGEGVVRVLTAGLARWGAPDVEASRVPTPATAAMGDLVLAVARAIANGASAGPLALTRDDLAIARGKAYPRDAGLPEQETVPVEVVGVHPEDGDPNDFVARIVPAGGEGPIGYVDLAERFFGPLLAASPTQDVLDARRHAAQEKLSASVGRWEAARAAGAKLLVLVPFPIPGDAGTESMWLEVTGADAKSVTGTVMDDPLGATEVKRGDVVTRPRTEVEDVELRGVRP